MKILLANLLAVDLVIFHFVWSSLIVTVNLSLKELKFTIFARWRAPAGLERGVGN